VGNIPSKHGEGKEGLHGFSIIVHGGAGSLAESNPVTMSRKRTILMKSVNNGFTVLKKGGSALDSVETAINYLEDSAEFNAGCGSCFAINGKVSMDAGIMDGEKTRQRRRWMYFRDEKSNFICKRYHGKNGPYISRGTRSRQTCESFSTQETEVYRYY
jgi:hypothetical protein